MVFIQDKSVATLAEQALLGGLLWAPQEADTVAAHIRGEHFRHPAHGAIYDAIVPLARDMTGPAAAFHYPADSKRRDPAGLDQWVRGVYDAVKAHPDARGITAPYLTELMGRCPHPQNLRAYARLVLEDHTRREIVAHAARSQQALAKDNPDLAPLTAAWRTAVDRLLANWGRLDLAPAKRLYQRSMTDQLTAVPGADTVVTRREAELIGGLLAAPDAFSRIATWLQPDDFASTASRGVYQAMLALRHRGDPVDPVTSAAEAQRLGALGGGGQHTAWDLLRLADQAAVTDLHTLAAQVQQHGIRRRLLAGATAVQQAARNPRIRPDQLLGLTTEHLTRTRAEQARGQLAHAPPITPSSVQPEPPRRAPSR